MTGDYVDHWPQDIKELLDNYVLDFNPKLGTFASLGNHDVDEKPDSRHTVTSAFSAAFPTIKLLVNESIKATPWLEVVGVGNFRHDFYPHIVDGLVNYNSTLDSYGQKVATIVLSHHPDSAKILSSYSVDLLLSGHTHGGNVPIILNLASVAYYLP